MDVYYEESKKSALQRIAARIGAVPKSKKTENFNYVSTWTGLTINTWGYLLINGLVPGTSGSQRIGREIFMTSIQGYIAVSQSQVPSIPSTRMMLVYDKQANGSALTAADVLQDATDRYSPYNFSNRMRFHVLYDSLFDTTPEQAPLNRFDYFPINLSTNYNDGISGTISDITTGSLYFMTYAVGTSNDISINLYYEE